MRGTWRRLRAMPDRERARVLAIISASLVVGILYGLGGLSLYLRATYLQGTPTAPAAQSVTEMPPGGEDGAVMPHPTLTPTGPPAGSANGSVPTLYPTITPRPGA